MDRKIAKIQYTKGWIGLGHLEIVRKMDVKFKYYANPLYRKRGREP